MWIHEVDGAGHRHGVGAVETLRAAGNVDAQIGRLIDALERTLRSEVNIFVTSDHGFSTNAGGFHVSRALRKGGVEMDDVKVVREMIFLERQDPELLKEVVEALQRDPHVGNVYTRARTPGSAQGIVSGTLSSAVIQWDHERAADVLATPAWSDEQNEHGFAGSSSRGGSSPASHGSDSPYDLRIPLVAAGPDIKRGVQSQVPTGNVDLAPTVLYLLGIEPPPSMNGRVLHELLREGPSPDEVAVREHTYSAEVILDEGLRYEAHVDTAKVGSTVYLRGARTDRSSSRSP
jgi:arylsulfatase A-like enzyme